MTLDFDNPPTDPIEQAKRWMADAAETGLTNPHAMTLATAGADGLPTARTVLLKGLDNSGIFFFTNRQSRKAADLAENSNAALLLYWDALQRQLAFEGPVSETSDEVSDAYFATRPRGAQVGAWASDQSQPIESRIELDRRVWQIIQQYEGTDIPRPPHWGGYRLEPRRIEFWQGRDSRLHDRIVYSRTTADAPWSVARLCP